MYRLCVDHESRQNGMELKHLKNSLRSSKNAHNAVDSSFQSTFLRHKRAADRAARMPDCLFHARHVCARSQPSAQQRKRCAIWWVPIHKPALLRHGGARPIGKP